MRYKKKEEWSVVPKGNERVYVLLRDRTKVKEKLNISRPSDCIKPKGRDCKQQIYEKAAKEAKRFGIRGNYVGLAAEYMDDIFLVYKQNGFQCIKGSAVNIEKSELFFQQISKFTNLLNGALRFRKYKTHFKCINGDILNTLRSNEHMDNVSIMDLDLMCCLNQDELKTKIFLAAFFASTKRSQLLVWSSIGRGIKWEEYKNEHLPVLIDMLSEEFDILLHTSDYYCDVEKHIPMKCERFILERING